MFGWIKTEEYSFNHFWLLEEFQIRLLFESSGWSRDKDEWRKNMSIMLTANPSVTWYLKQRAPKVADIIDELINSAPTVEEKTVHIHRKLK